ncbi:MAG: hypothetical protein PHF07_01130 [Candidatus Pacebacteria bacterium]|jgi:hypothetical protein|nr:hypothetical protein [Candidatus Paceibacterota bacterium]
MDSEEKNNQLVSSKLINLMESEDASLWITKICMDNGVKEEDVIENVSYQVGLALLGKLPPKDLPKSLEEKAGLSHEIARDIYQGIDQRLLSQVREELSKMYPVSPEQPKQAEEAIKNPPKGKDTYREKVE